MVQGKTTAVTASTHDLRETAAGGSFELRMTLSLRALGLEPPRALLGALRVRDAVEVAARVQLAR